MLSCVCEIPNLDPSWGEYANGARLAIAYHSLVYSPEYAYTVVSDLKPYN